MSDISNLENININIEEDQLLDTHNTSLYPHIDIVTFRYVNNNSIVILKFNENKIVCCWHLSYNTLQTLQTPDNKYIDNLNCWNNIEYDNIILIWDNSFKSIIQHPYISQLKDAKVVSLMKGPQNIIYNHNFNVLYAEHIDYINNGIYTQINIKRLLSISSREHKDHKT